jgi:hypothetical protein
MGFLRGVWRLLVYDGRVLQRDVQGLLRRCRKQFLQWRFVEQLERRSFEQFVVEQLERWFLQQQLERRRIEQFGRRSLRFGPTFPSHWGNERLGVALLGLLQASMRMDGERVGHASDELLQLEFESGDRLRPGQRVRRRKCIRLLRPFSVVGL